MYIYDNISLSSFRIKEDLEKFVLKIKTHILCSVNFFPKIVLFMR